MFGPCIQLLLIFVPHSSRCGALCFNHNSQPYSALHRELHERTDWGSTAYWIASWTFGAISADDALKCDGSLSYQERIQNRRGLGKVWGFVFFISWDSFLTMSHLLFCTSFKLLNVASMWDREFSSCDFTRYIVIWISRLMNCWS